MYTLVRHSCKRRMEKMKKLDGIFIKAAPLLIIVG